MGRKRATADELLASAEANRYKEGKHREEDAVCDSNKHVERTQLALYGKGKFA